MRWNMRPGRHQRDPTPLRDPGRPQRIDIPVYLDAGVALSLSASLSRGLVMESTVERPSPTRGRPTHALAQQSRL